MCSKLAMITELFEKTVVNSKSFDRRLRNVKLMSCGDGVVIAEIQVGSEHLNDGRILHGGFIADLVDTLSTFTLLANDRGVGRGLSIDLSVSYLSMVSEGNKLEIKVVAKKGGNRIVFLEVQIRNMENDQLVAKGITWPVERPEDHVRVWSDLDHKRFKLTELSPTNSYANRVDRANRLQSWLASQSRTHQDQSNDE